MSSPGPARRFLRDAGWPVAIAAAALWLTFFGSAGAVDPTRLVGPSGRPHGMVFSLTALGVALVVTAAVLLQTATLFLVGLVVAVAGVVGAVRAIRFAYLGG